MGASPNFADRVGNELHACRSNWSYVVSFKYFQTKFIQRVGVSATAGKHYWNWHFESRVGRSYLEDPLYVSPCWSVNVRICVIF